MRSTVFALGFGFLLAATALSCGSDEATARAYQIKSLDQAIGGPVADARVGDFILENDKIRVAVEGGRSSRLFLDVGGTLIDADVVRPDADGRTGRGKDQLGQIAPVSNLFIAKALEPDTVRITHALDKAAEITTAAPARPIQNILLVLGVLVSREYIGSDYDHGKFQIYNEYKLRPGERVVRITTTVGHDLQFCPPEPDDECNAECDDILFDSDCKCAKVPDRCFEGARKKDGEIVTANALPDGENRGLLDILMGDLPRPLGTGKCETNAECVSPLECVSITTPLGGGGRVCRRPDQLDAGVALGDMLLFGGNLGIFLPGSGYDSLSDFHRLFARNIDTLGNPLPLDAVYALGDGVSYGYSAPNGKALVPFFGGSFSFGATGAVACRHDDKGCLAGKLIRAERWVSVGFGDAASAREPLDRARGIALGEITGRVIRASTAEPISSAKVLAFRDPRDIACEGDCAKRCGAAPDGDTIDSWSVDDLIAANKCRTVDSTFLEGTAAIETGALTDIGTRPVQEGKFHMALPPGRYVLVASSGDGPASRMARVGVAANRTNHVSFALERTGKLEYAIFDASGHKTAGRVLIGRCFPGKECSDDGDCSGEDTCRAGACACEAGRLRPLELGGARLADGALAETQTATGDGSIDLPAGKYDVIFAHGPQQTLDRTSVTIQSGLTTKVHGTVIRSVDRAGWSASDFHVHADPSLDSDLPLRDRATSYLAEDMDFMSSSDHDTLTSYESLLEEMGVRDQLGTQVGVEVSTQEIGHFIGWPLKRREWKNGKRIEGNGALDWRGLEPGEIMAGLRKLEDKLPVVVEVPHPYSYFDYYNLDPVSLEPKDTLLATINPLLSARVFSGEFDTMEIVNGKNANFVRRATVDELRFFSKGIDALKAKLAAGDIDDAEYSKLFYQLSVDATRQILHRTPAEQAASLAGQGNELECLCGADGDCAAGTVCNPETLTCARPEDVPADPTPAPGTSMCRKFRGVVDDWFNMLNRGMRRPVLSGSDTHDLYGGEAGIPRTMIMNDGTTGAYLGEDTVRDAVLGGHSFVTNGPMIRFTVDGKGLGSTVKSGGSAVELSLRIETADWYDVDRVEIYRNGELIHWISGCDSVRDEGMEDPDGHKCIESSSSSPVVFDEKITDEPDEDSWYVVLAMGLDGRTLAPVYSSATLPPVGTFEVAQKIFDLIPVLSTFRTPRNPSLFPTFPLAVTNPVWVDVDGDGWKPKNPPASWCRRGKDVGCD